MNIFKVTSPLIFKLNNQPLVNYFKYTIVDDFFFINILGYLHLVRYTSRWWCDGRGISAHNSYNFITVHFKERMKSDHDVVGENPLWILWKKNYIRWRNYFDVFI